MNLATMDVAMARVGATDAEAFKVKTKKLGCLYEYAGVVKVDIDKLEAALNSEFEKIAEKVSAPKAKPRREGSDLGLILARLALNPQRIEAKKQKIKDAESKLASASTPYEKVKIKRELAKLNDELQRLLDGQTRDISQRDAILNSNVQ